MCVVWNLPASISSCNFLFIMELFTTHFNFLQMSKLFQFCDNWNSNTSSNYSDAILESNKVSTFQHFLPQRSRETFKNAHHEQIPAGDPCRRRPASLWSILWFIRWCGCCLWQCLHRLLLCNPALLLLQWLVCELTIMISIFRVYSIFWVMSNLNFDYCI